MKDSSSWENAKGKAFTERMGRNMKVNSLMIFMKGRESCSITTVTNMMELGKRENDRVTVFFLPRKAQLQSLKGLGQMT